MSLRPPPIKELPEDYREVYYLSVTDMVQMTRLNLAALLLTVVFLVLTIAWTVLIYANRDPITVSTQIPALFLWIGVFLVLLLHEWLHGLAIQWFQHKPIYGMKFANVGRLKLPLLLYTTAGDVYFGRYSFIFIALVPVVVITLVGMAFIALLPDYLTYYLVVAIIINGSGAIGDFWMTWVVLRYPHDALVRDEADSIRVYIRTTPDPEQG
jgi:hypothetical protein